MKRKMIEEECAICQDMIKVQHFLPCQHVYCKKCIIGMIPDEHTSYTFHSNCPKCKDEFEIDLMKFSRHSKVNEIFCDDQEEIKEELIIIKKKFQRIYHKLWLKSDRFMIIYNTLKEIAGHKWMQNPMSLDDFETMVNDYMKMEKVEPDTFDKYPVSGDELLCVIDLTIRVRSVYPIIGYKDGMIVKIEFDFSEEIDNQDDRYSFLETIKDSEFRVKKQPLSSGRSYMTFAPSSSSSIDVDGATRMIMGSLSSLINNY